MTDNAVFEKIINILLAGDYRALLTFLESSKNAITPGLFSHLYFIASILNRGLNSHLSAGLQGQQTGSPVPADLSTFINTNSRAFDRMEPGKSFYNIGVYLKKKKLYKAALVYCKVSNFLLSGNTPVLMLYAELELLNKNYASGLSLLHRAAEAKAPGPG